MGTKKCDALEVKVQAMAEQLAKVKETVQKLIQANNSVSLLCGCFDRWMDENHPGWDGGLRESMQRQVQDMHEREQIIAKVTSPAAADMPDDEMSELAGRMWAIAGRSGTEQADFANVVAMYFKAGDLRGARRVLDHAKDGDTVAEGFDSGQVGILERRYEELAARSSDVSTDGAEG